MYVKLIRYTPDPERAVATAARLCYAGVSAVDLDKKLNDTTVANMVTRMVSSGHGSTLEHAVFTFAVDEVSRVLTHQLVRHRLASYDQQSQRYTDSAGGGFTMPPTIADNNMLIEFGDQRFTVAEACENAVRKADELYRALTAAGVPKEDARYLLPQGAHTRILVTMNARELLHFFALRCCTRAQWEIRELAERMLAEVKKVAPTLFAFAGPTCAQTHGHCPEEHGCERWRQYTTTQQ